ncbi:MAG: hypothetical protein H0V00_02595 [Chloroflexia bacterium]|nr:hypothetical protein [Chloroflexia bacterium]
MRRRSVLLSAAASALTAAFAGDRTHAVAQESTPAALAEHPLTGTWLAMANPPQPDDPQFPAPSLFSADGTVLLVFPATQMSPQGVVFNAPVVGTWEADSKRRGHFTAVQLLSDVDGVFLGSVTIDGYPEVSEDGNTFIDDGSKAVATIRDASGTIVQQAPAVGARAVTAVRMGVGSPGFLEGTPAAGTPAP